MHTIHKGEVPFLILLMPFMTGITTGIFLNDIGLALYLTTGLLGSGGLFILLNFVYNKLKVQRYSWIGGILLHIVLLTAGWLTAILHNELNHDRHFSRVPAKDVLVKVTGETIQKGKYIRFNTSVLRSVSGINVSAVQGSLLVTVVADSNSRPFAYGDLLLIPANYKPVDPPFNPAEFNYQRYLAHQNIHFQSFLTKGQVLKIGSNAGNPLIARSLKIRQSLVDKFKQYMHDPQAAAVASTLILGFKADLSSDILQAYSKTGTIHVLSVSGAHVLVIFIFISFLLKFLDRHKYGRILNAVLSVTLIWAYALLTGFSPAVCRAALMISMWIIGKAINRQAHALNGLSVSAFILLLYDPLLITDVGFQLSYLAVVGLIVLHPVIQQLFDFKSKWARKAWTLCSASVAAQLITFPLSAYYFHQFPVYFLVSNLLIIIPSELIMIGGLIFSAFSNIEWLAKPLGYILEHMILMLNAALSWIEHLPYASVGRIWFGNMEWLLCYVIIIAGTVFLIQRKAWQMAAGIVAIMLLFISSGFTTVNKLSANHIVLFNTKKHSAILFQHGDRAVVVTDLDRTDKNFGYSIQPCLDSLNATHITVLKPNQNARSNFFKKQLNLIQFLNQRVVVFDSQLQNKPLSHKIKTDYLFLTGSPQTGLKFITENYGFGTLVFDANNSPQRVKQWLSEGERLKLKIINLKRNKALVIASK